MPNVLSVNLSYLQRNKTGSAAALYNLASFANGPLRLQKKVENGVTVRYLGVRSWSTYFFEKLIATSGQVAKAELKTRCAIESEVRHFLNNSGLTLGCEAETLTAGLHAKAVGKSILPVPAAKAGTEAEGRSGSRPDYVETRGKLFRGAGTVPAGLSVAVVPPLKIIADVRLVSAATFASHPAGDNRMGSTRSLAGLPDTSMKTGIDDFKKYYLDQLKPVAGFISTSVVIEVQRDSGDTCSKANQEGARQAATEFTRTQALKGKHVSVMLTVPGLPPVTKLESATVVEVDTRAKGKSTAILADDSSSENNIDSDD